MPKRRLPTRSSQRNNARPHCHVPETKGALSRLQYVCDKGAPRSTQSFYVPKLHGYVPVSLWNILIPVSRYCVKLYKILNFNELV